ncbi:hypothetical protein ASPZODRAFT_127124 [Penicilliopsis zonata CBS 506.65]|uniref:Fungal-type protein kinase domain-containing protein n=1 Tax=Penicilliopsis zonata CBS 506.65 TaxID=1073090 RepID=A0A1L9SVH4_9EURO|nr:hypothetical protein ASPZODRAFT_127124 [Penicilliopsis zonata CBS 506.65]OJJ51111.1 hypothetical protein ASPZODRAFT_127124 [Penicilliopsis zonata CBS 506.65]
MGVFGVPYTQQFHLVKLLDRETGAQKDAKKPTLDGPNEELVNSALLSFLTAVCFGHPAVKSYWSPRRATLTAKFRKGAEAGKPSLSCQVDGFLVSSAGHTQVLIEAKSRDRCEHEPNVSWQETYEIVSALLTPTPKGLPKNG